MADDATLPRDDPPAEAPPRPAWRDERAAEPWLPDALAGLAWAAEAGAPVALARGAAAGWRAAGASRRGRLHAHHGAHREDALAIRAGAARLALAVSDGAGSSPLSRVGSEAAVRAAALAVAGHAGGSAAAVAAGVHAARDAIAELAARAGRPEQDFRCTLLLAACDAQGVCVTQVGDGAVAVEGPDGAVAIAARGDHGEFSGEVAAFLPDLAAADAAAADVRRVAGAAVRTLLLMTDGVEDPWYPLPRTGPLLLAQLRDGVGTAAAGFTAQEVQPGILGAPDAAARLAHWLTFEKRGENDDRTLVVAWRDGA